MSVFIFGSFFLLLTVILLSLVVLNFFRLYDQRRFTGFEGELNRGLTIGRKPLSPDMYWFLKSLPPVTRCDQFFIRREKAEVLMAEEHVFSSFWEMWWEHRTGWAYVAYVDLSQPKSQIQ